MPDANDATSEAIFVFTNVAPTVAVGDDVQVVGTVTEFRPGGAASTNLTTTELTSPAITVLILGQRASRRHGRRHRRARAARVR